MKNRIFFISDVIIILLLLGFTINTILSTYIYKKILEEIPRDKYEFSIDHIRINIFSGFLGADIIKLKKKNVNIEIIDLNRISVSGLSIMKYLLYHKLFIDKIELSDGILRIEKNKENRSSAETFKSISDGGIEAEIRMIEFINMKVNVNAKTKPVFSCSSSRASIYNLSLGKNNPKLNIDSISTEINNSIFVSEDSFYTMFVNRIGILSGQKNASIAGIKLSPNYDKKEFSRKMGQQTDRFEANIESANARGFNLIRFLLGDTLLVEELHIDSAIVNVYRDKYFQSRNTKKRMIQSIIKDMPILLDVKKCRINNSKLTYSELTPPAKEPGNISLTKIEAKVENISNIDSLDMILSSICTLNNKAPLSVIAVFPKYSSGFNIKGNLKNLEMKNFNPLLESSSSLTVTNGIIDSLRFNFGLRNRTIDGTVLLQFHDFRVASIDPETKDTTGLVRNLKTEIANRIVLKSENHNQFGELHPVNVSREYKENYFITNNIIKSIISGVEKSVVRGKAGDGSRK